MSFPAAWIEEKLRDQAAGHGIPGVSYALSIHGDLVASGGIGVTSIEDPHPVTDRTLFQIGSTTKPAVATAAARLVAGGLLRLDEPIGRLFDTAAARSFYGGMTLRDLLSHSAGLPREQVTPVRMYGDPGASLAHYVERDLPQRGQGAAEGWGYSNAGFAVIAHALERAAGTPFPDLMQQVVFDPLNMRRTTFDHATAVTFPVAAAHVDDDEGDIEVLRPAPRNEALYPAAFLFSTATDLVRLGNLHLGFFESAEDLLPETLRREMRKPHRETFDEELPAYGLGFYTEFPKTRQFGHVGGIGGYGARLDIDASSGAVGAVLFNRMPEEGWPEANLLRFVDQALEK